MVERTAPVDRSSGLLRRADWRFLLPRPAGEAFQHLAILGGPDGLAEQVTAMGLAERVSTTLPLERIADAVAVLHDAVISPERIAGALLPGGCLYMEVSRQSVSSLRTSPARTWRMLRATGLTPVGSYLVMPHFDAIELYLPVNGSGALDWYFTSIYKAASPQQRLFEEGLRLVAHLGPGRVAQLAPHFAVTAIAGGIESGAPSILANPALPAHLQGQKLLPVLLTDAGNRVTVLPFGAGDRRPRAILKIPKLPAYNGRTENEHEMLTRIRSRLDEHIRSTLPQPLALLAHGDICVTVESYLPGQSLERTCRRWGVPLEQKIRGLRLAADWLVQFHTWTLAERPAWGLNERTAWLEGSLDAYEEAFGLTDDERRLFALTRRHSDNLTGHAFPIVLQHRDYNIWNIFHDRSGIRVIDWEGCRPGPALCDLIHFVAHWHDAVRGTRNRADRLHAYRRLFCEPGTTDRAIVAAHRAIADYMRRLDLDQQFFPLLLVYTWVELALRRHQRQKDRGDVPPDIRGGNQSTAFVELLAANADILFCVDPQGSSVPA